MKERLKLEYVKKEIEKFGYKLHSNTYKNAFTYLDVECNEGHRYKSTYNNLQRGKRCSICLTNKCRNSVLYIKEQIENENGYKLLSNEYFNNRRKLQISCPVNHLFEMTYNNFHQGNRCPYCNKMKPFSKTEKEIYDYVLTIYSDIVIPNDRTTIRNGFTKRWLELDIWLPKIKKAIEYNGLYAHREEQKEQRWRDEIKIKQCKQKGIDLLVINESQWSENKDWSIINHFING